MQNLNEAILFIFNFKGAINFKKNHLPLIKAARISDNARNMKFVETLFPKSSKEKVMT